MRRVYKYMVMAVLSAMTIGCIENDIPYPVVKLEILDIEAEGLKSAASIDSDNYTVKLELVEQTDIREVDITSVTLTEGAESHVEFPATFDMRNPLYVTLSMYQTFEWTITASQYVERYFTVDGQIGESEIDPVGHIVRVYMPKGTDLTNIKVTSAKLGPKDVTTYSPDPLTLTSFDGTVRNVEVCYHGDIEELWTIFVETKDVDVELECADAWAKRIWLKANGRSDVERGFRYRLAGSEEWIEVSGVEHNAGRFSACVEGLEPLTDYEVVAYCGESTTPIVALTTEDVFTLPNSGFEAWSTYDGCIYPYAEGDAPFWGTGNPGAAIANATLTSPVADVRPGSEGSSAASLQSMKAAVMGIGKFAAGNLFVGNFAGLSGLDGIVHFGRPCTARPVALRGWVKYNCGVIDEVGRVPAARPNLAKGDNDEGQIMVAVGNWSAEEYGGVADSPVAVDTKDESTYFNHQGKDVIGSGQLLFNESTDGWVEFVVPLEYRSTSEIPTHIIIVFTGSHFGDYFTGSTQSLMLVDDVELVY